MKNWTPTKDFETDDGFANRNTAYWNPWYVHMYRHSGFRVNMLYLDGHAGSIQTILYSGQINYVWSYQSSP